MTLNKKNKITQKNKKIIINSIKLSKNNLIKIFN